MSAETQPNISDAKIRRYEQKTHYELLGLRQGATAEEIDYAYREISKVYDPDSEFYRDVFPYELSEQDKQIFKLVTLAYETLRCSESREAYDLSLNRPLPHLHR